jgi:competence protein ComEC
VIVAFSWHSRGILVAALAAVAGALTPHRVPLWIVVGILLAGLATRRSLGRSVLVIVAVGALCSTLADRSWSGLEAINPTGLAGDGSVVSDPIRSGAGTTAVVRVDGRRYLATAYGGAGARLRGAQAGDSIAVSGKIRPYGGPDERRAALHIGNRLSVHAIAVKPTSNPLWRAANGLRNLIGGGAEPMGSTRQALFTGIVYGDDRGQSPVTEADFRLAGLTHLLAVSGQNVAYVLTVCRPLIQRRSLTGRWVTTLTILVLFATVTRFEPSVLRATVMAGLAVTARTVGREASAGRLLALAVIVLLVVDPLLATTVAFGLSVAASAGILWISPGVAGRVRGPEWLRESLGVTVGAQLAVAPVLVTTFGPISLVSVPANVVAGPIAGLVMAWGMTAGIVAGFGRGWLAGPIHTVSTAGLISLEATARAAAALPLPPVGIGWLVVAIAVVGARPWWRTSAGTRLAAAVVLCALAAAVVPSTSPGS